MSDPKQPPGFQETDEDIELRDAPPTEAELAEMDAWLYRNRHALNASMKKAEEEYARGETRSGKEVFAELRAKLRGKG